MTTCLKGGTVIDPAHLHAPVRRDLWIQNGRISTEQPDQAATTIHDCGGMVIMAGGIDLHTHIGGGKVNLARAMLPEEQRKAVLASTEFTDTSCLSCAPGTLATGYRYAEMGYTACFEPAMLPVNARQAHLEMGDTPIVDKGAYVMLGSDDFLLRLLRDKRDQRVINDYVAWTINASQALGVKVVNPGGISAFKFNQRKMDLDDAHVHYGVTPRQVLVALAEAVSALGVAHPLHVHASNLGVPGNIDTTIATMDAAEGRPVHLTHIQFHSYGKEGDFKFSSGAARIAEAINARPNVSCDVGQIMFGQTVTASGDSMSQYRNAGMGKPRKSVIMDIECDAGCGVVPFKYRDQSFVNALQWAIGLEIFLLVKDPWRVFLTTDHPNGAPFWSYPHLIRLLCDKTFRNDQLKRLHPEAQKMTTLASIDREYTLQEIAIMTRAAPARTLGLADRGHLGVGAAADIAVYRENLNREAMFEKPAYVFKDGTLVAKEGKIVATPWGNTHVTNPEYDRGIERELRTYFATHHTQSFDSFAIDNDELCECGHGNKRLQHACIKGRKFSFNA